MSIRTKMIVRAVIALTVAAVACAMVGAACGPVRAAQEPAPSPPVSAMPGMPGMPGMAAVSTSRSQASSGAVPGAAVVSMTPAADTGPAGAAPDGVQMEATSPASIIGRWTIIGLLGLVVSVWITLLAIVVRMRRAVSAQVDEATSARVTGSSPAPADRGVAAG